MSFYILFDTIGGSCMHEIIQESSYYNADEEKDVERLVKDINFLISLHYEDIDHKDIDFISSIPNMNNDDVTYFIGNYQELEDGNAVVCIKKYSL